MALVLINEFMMNALGIVDATFADYATGNFRNSAFVFGIPDQLAAARPIARFLTPKVFLYHPITGEFMHWPLIWVFFPLLAVTLPIGTMMYLIFERKQTINYIKSIFQKKRILENA
jgi:hypothetical protein